MTIDTPITPRRRSKRGQPIVSAPVAVSSGPSDVTPSDVVYTRSTHPDDLLDAEVESLRDGELELDDLETRFYRSYTLSQKVRGKSNRRKTQEAIDEEDTYRVGDTVRVYVSTRQPSVGVIVAIWSVVGEDVQPVLRLKVHWFTRPLELPGIRAKRSYYENEVYYSLSSTATVPVSSIKDRCSVHSIPEGSVPSTSSLGDKMEAFEVEDAPFEDGRTFCCRSAISSQHGLYYEFTWEEHRAEALATPEEEYGSGTSWDLVPKEPVKSKKKDESDTVRKKRRLGPIREVDEEEEGSAVGDGEYRDESVQSSDSDEPEVVASEEEAFGEKEDIPRTPSGKRKRAPSTPRRKRTSALAAPTPHSKAALRARANRKRIAVRPVPPDRSTDISLHLESLPQDPWLRAMHVLHVASRPEALPCRDEEYRKVLRSVEELVDEGSGGCVYISGVPGTGKTATVHAVVRELKRMAEHNEGNPFTYVEINGLRIPDPSAAYGLLWEAVSGHDAAKEGHLKVSSKEALKQLSKHFSTGGAGPSGHACVVLMDELDQLMTSKQDVVYNFFNWPTLIGSRLVVLAVANTMDLPERVMTGRVRSRLGMTRINFQPYTTPQLEQIVKARLASSREGLPSDCPNVMTPDGIKFASMKVSSISGDARRVLDICRRTVELVQPRSKTAGTEDVKQVIKDMQNSPTAAYIRDLSFHERLMLAAMLRCIRKEGVEEIRWGDLQHQHQVYLNLLCGAADSLRKPSPGELALVLGSLAASRAILYEEGAIVAKKGPDERRVVLNLENAEVERVLGEVGGIKWKNTLNI